MPGVFISYRRDDTAGYAGRLYDALTADFGKEHVFIDIDSIGAGQNFADVIEQQIASCSVVIVLIGKGWLASTDEHAARRLDNPRDFVRLEVASALRRKLPVIPVLVGGAKMPRPDDLPPPRRRATAIRAPQARVLAMDRSVRGPPAHLGGGCHSTVDPGNCRDHLEYETQPGWQRIARGRTAPL
jgi:hypothetical protein